MPRKHSSNSTAPVRWTSAEKDTFRAAVIQSLEADPTLTRTPAVLHAQHVLPEDRRRSSLVEWSQVKGWLKLPKSLADQFDEKGHRTPPGNIKRSQPPQFANSTHARADGRTKVFWKPAEQEILARGVALALHQGRTKSRIEALQMAQEELPEHRRRKLGTIGGLPWFKPMVEKALKQVQDAQAKLDRKAAAERAAVEAAAVAAPAHPIATLPTPPAVATPTAALPNMFGAQLDGLRTVLVEAFAGIFREALVQAVKSIALPSGEVPPSADTPSHSSTEIEVRPAHDPRATNGLPRPTRASVLVAGLKGAQREIIKHQFGNQLDLRFYGADESKDQLKAMTTAADVTVAVTDFLSHSHTDTIKARSPHYIPSGGGMNTLRDALQSIVQAQASQTAHANGARH